MLARFFSFASLEILRFLELTTARRLVFLTEHWWLAPLAVVAWAVGIAQPLWMLREWLRPKSQYPEWPALKALVAGTVVLVYASYWFAIERASQAHAFYLLAPVAFLFAAYCWTFLDSPTWRRRAAAILAINIAYHGGLAWAQAPEKSLYRNRDVVATAIRLKQPEMFGHRRAFAVDVGTPCVCALPRDPDPRLDIAIGEPTRTAGPRGLVQWTFTLHNQNSRSAFRDVVCVTKYRNAAGATILTRQTMVSSVFQPGETRLAQANDGFIQAPFTTATLEVMDAEALVPLPRPVPPGR